MFEIIYFCYIKRHCTCASYVPWQHISTKFNIVPFSVSAHYVINWHCFFFIERYVSWLALSCFLLRLGSPWLRPEMQRNFELKSEYSVDMMLFILSCSILFQATVWTLSLFSIHSCMSTLFWSIHILNVIGVFAHTKTLQLNPRILQLLGRKRSRLVCHVFL